MLKLYNNQALQLSTCKDHALQENNGYRLTSLESTITEVIRLLIHDFARSHLHHFPHAQLVPILHSTARRNIQSLKSLADCFATYLLPVLY